MMVRSPGNISYSYNFTLEKVAYNTEDRKQYCHVSDFSNCEISLRSDNFKHVYYNIIAYIQPSEFENSIVTHFCVSTHSGSATLTKLSYVDDALFGVVGALLVVATVLCVCMLAMQNHKHKHSEERQKLLHRY